MFCVLKGNYMLHTYTVSQTCYRIYRYFPAHSSYWDFIELPRLIVLLFQVDLTQIYQLNPQVNPALVETETPQPPPKQPQQSKPATKNRVSSARIPLSNVQHAPSPKVIKEERG